MREKRQREREKGREKESAGKKPFHGEKSVKRRTLESAPITSQREAKGKESSLSFLWRGCVKQRLYIIEWASLFRTKDRIIGAFCPVSASAPVGPRSFPAVLFLPDARLTFRHGIKGEIKHNTAFIRSAVRLLDGSNEWIRRICKYLTARSTGMEWIDSTREDKGTLLCIRRF